MHTEISLQEGEGRIAGVLFFFFKFVLHKMMKNLALDCLLDMPTLTIQYLPTF